MFNKLTNKKLEDTSIKSKDGKGYILDIRRPSAKRNSETYEQDENASFKGLNIRTGLGNRSIRRVNFIKPEIKPRQIREGRLQQTPMKSLQEMIKEGIKIKYEEPDPWDETWINAKNKIVANMKSEVPPKTDIEIAEYLQKYPPLGRTQRTRPVNKNPLEDANEPIKDQLKKIGDNVYDVNQSVVNSTTNANTIATNQMSQSQLLKNWLDTQMSSLQAVIQQVGFDSDNGRNLLGAKLQQIVQELSYQKAITQKQLMVAVDALKIDTTLIKELDIVEILKPDMTLPIMALLAKYKYDLYTNPNVFTVIDNNNNSTENLSWNEVMAMMSKNPNIRLINDMNKQPKPEIYFKDMGTGIATPSVQEQQATQLQLTSLSMEPEDIEQDIITEQPKKQIPVDVYEDIKESDINRANNIQSIIKFLEVGLENVAKTKYTKRYDLFMKDELGVEETNKRILKFNLDYKYQKNNSGQYIQTNPDFLSINLLGAKEPMSKKTKIKPFFKYIYDDTDDPYNVYFVWSSIFGVHHKTLAELSTYMTEMTNTITDELTKIIEQTPQTVPPPPPQPQLPSSMPPQLPSSMPPLEAKDNPDDKAKKLAIDKKYKKDRDIYTKKQEAKKKGLDAQAIIHTSKAEKEEKQRLLNIKKDEDDVKEKEQFVNKIKLSIENIKNKGSPQYSDLLKNLQTDINDDTSIIILERDKNIFKLVEYEKDSEYEFGDRTYGSYVFNNLLDVQYADDGDNQNITYYGILINTDTVNYVFNVDEFVKELNDNLPATGSGYNDILNTIKSKIAKIKKGLENIANNTNNKYNTLLTSSEQDTLNKDSNIIIIKYVDKIEFLESSKLIDYMTTNKYNFQPFTDTLDISSSGLFPTIFGISINTNFYPSFDSKEFIDSMNINSGNGKNKIRAYNKTMSGKGKKENPWLAHVKKFRASNPTLKYSDVLKQAKATYKK
jgi:hypothetical protein